MKKLNEDVIRKLIVETLEEVSLGEGRKKKVEEVDDATKAAEADAMKSLTPDESEDISAGHAQVAANIAGNTMNPQVPSFDVAKFMESFKEAENIITAGLKGGGTMGVSSARNALKTLESMLPKEPKE